MDAKNDLAGVDTRCADARSRLASGAANFWLEQIELVTNAIQRADWRQLEGLLVNAIFHESLCRFQRVAVIPTVKDLAQIVQLREDHTERYLEALQRNQVIKVSLPLIGLCLPTSRWLVEDRKKVAPWPMCHRAWSDFKSWLRGLHKDAAYKGRVEVAIREMFPDEDLDWAIMDGPPGTISIAAGEDPNVGLPPRAPNKDCPPGQVSDSMISSRRTAGADPKAGSARQSHAAGTDNPGSKKAFPGEFAEAAHQIALGSILPTSPGPSGSATATGRVEAETSASAVAVESSAWVPLAKEPEVARRPGTSVPATMPSGIGAAGSQGQENPDGAVKGPELKGSGPFRVQPDASKPDASKPDASASGPAPAQAPVSGLASAKAAVPEDCPKELREPLERLAESLVKGTVPNFGTGASKTVPKFGTRGETRTSGSQSAVPNFGTNTRAGAGESISIKKRSTEESISIANRRSELIAQLDEAFSGEIEIDGQRFAIAGPFGTELKKPTREKPHGALHLWWALATEAQEELECALAEFRCEVREGLRRINKPPHWIVASTKQKIGMRRWAEIFPKRDRLLARKAGRKEKQ